jgi:hypothetical protein
MTEVQYPPGAEFFPDNENESILRPENGPHSILRRTQNEALQKERALDKDRDLQQIIFEAAIETACDWFEATEGEPLSKQVFQNLYDNGYASNTPAEILEIFYDWEDFQAVAQSYYEERENPNVAKKKLVESLRQEATAGLVPAVFFKKAETYRINNPSGKKKLIRYRITEEEATDEVILERYYKYLVADYVTRNRESEDEITEERKINIALGFTQETKKPLSSFYTALKNSNSSLTREQLILAIEELKAFEYIYPESRDNHLNTLLLASKVGGSEKPEYYYDLKLKKVIMLGRTALDLVAPSDGRRHLEWLKEQKKLLIGSTAVKAFIAGEERGSLYELAQLLYDEELANKEVGKRSVNNGLSREDVIEYAHWLISISADAKSKNGNKDLS